MNEGALETLRDPDIVQAAEVYPFELPAIHHNEAHRAIRRAMERGGEVHAIPGGFVWRDDTWYADASVSVVSAEDNTAVTVLVSRRLESLVCRLGTPLLGAFGLATVAGGEGGLVGLVAGIAGGLLLDGWAGRRWRRRAWSALDALGVLASETARPSGATPPRTSAT